MVCHYASWPQSTIDTFWEVLPLPLPTCMSCHVMQQQIMVSVKESLGRVGLHFLFKLLSLTSSIARTTSMPLVTLPNTTCLPSSQGVCVQGSSEQRMQTRKGEDDKIKIKMIRIMVMKVMTTTTIMMTIVAKCSCTRTAVPPLWW